MWIRSQDKLELSEVKSISSNKIDDGWVIFVNERWFGMYESKERCSEILDDIQSWIHPCKKIEGNFAEVQAKSLALLYRNWSMVYQMPEE